MDKNQNSTSHKEEVDEDINDRLEDMIYNIGEDSFRKARVYDTLCSDKDETLYKECINLHDC